jgi:hypothetical protein
MNYANTVVLTEKEPVTAEARKMLLAAYKEHAALLPVKSELTAEEVKFIREITAEAHTEFLKFKADLFAKPLDELAGRVMDNGKIDVDRVRRKWDELRNDLLQEKMFFNSMRDFKLTPADFTVERQAVYQCPTPADAEKNSAALAKTESVLVKFKLPESAGLGDVLLPRRANNLTVAADGTFIVVMRKENGRWYWNPFGW